MITAASLRLSALVGATLFLLSACQAAIQSTDPQADRPASTSQTDSDPYLECGFDFEEDLSSAAGRALHQLHGRWLNITSPGYRTERDRSGTVTYTRSGFEVDFVSSRVGAIEFAYTRENPFAYTLQRVTEPKEDGRIVLGAPLDAGPFRGFRPLEIHSTDLSSDRCSAYLVKIETGPRGKETLLATPRVERLSEGGKPPLSELTGSFRSTDVRHFSRYY